MPEKIESDQGTPTPCGLEAQLDAPTILPRSNLPPASGTAQYFGGFELLEEIARGGVGIVYKARQRSLNRIVALKMLLTGTNASKDERERFQDEAEAVAQLTHSGIVPIYDVGECEGQRYFTMAFVPGQNLAERIADGPLSPCEAATLLRQVAEAVSYAHVQGIIHRDLKPANILLDDDGKPVVTDFGIAKMLDTTSCLTSVGDVLGTPNYMPPEQAGGDTEAIGVRSDVYSLGAILYALVTGRPPFQAATSLDTILQVLDGEPVPPRQLNREVSRDLNTIVMKCLEKAPARRYWSASALAEDLRRFLDSEPILARDRSPIESALGWCRKHLVVASVSGFGASMLMLVAAAATLGYHRESTLRRQLETELAATQEQLQASETLLEMQRFARNASQRDSEPSATAATQEGQE